jgi:hypothetical protein
MTTFRVWCLYSYFFHGVYVCRVLFMTAIFALPPPPAWRKGGEGKPHTSPIGDTDLTTPVWEGMKGERGGGEGTKYIHQWEDIPLTFRLFPPLSLSRMQQSLRPRVMPDRVNITCLRSLLTGVLWPFLESWAQRVTYLMSIGLFLCMTFLCLTYNLDFGVVLYSGTVLCTTVQGLGYVLLRFFCITGTVFSK